MQDNPRRLLLRLGVKLMFLIAFSVILYVLFAAIDDQVPTNPNTPPQLHIPLAELDADEFQRIHWQGGNLILLRHSVTVRKLLGRHDDQLRERRAFSDQHNIYLTYDRGSGIGCPLQWLPPADSVNNAPLQPWPGGFRDSCDGSWYDAAGRVFQGQSVSRNLESPPYRIADGLLSVGVNGDNPIPTK